ncbi:MAG TPA: hypothetical protein VIP46_02115 [Pyrinomonadaceae bacterium]
MRRAISKAECRAVLCLACLLVCAATGRPAGGGDATPKIVCRTELAEARRLELAAQLRAITGWAGLRFDDEGALRFGDGEPRGGSASARALLASAREGNDLIVIEDASGRADVAFCRILEGRWKNGAAGRPAAHVLQVDFKDFSHVMGDEAARAAFNAGWAVLHEVAHAVHDSADSDDPDEAGECEELINLMRRECGLAERAEYFFTPLPGTWHGKFKSRFVRLAFERRAERRTKRYWLVWDAGLVGGLDRAAR